MKNVCFFRWTGGKYRVLNTLYSLFPDCEEYYEPFLGSGAVLINKYRTSKEVANDLDPELYTLHKVMADRECMLELLRELNRIDERIGPGDKDDPVEQAERKRVFKEAKDVLAGYAGKDWTQLTKAEEIEIAKWKYVKTQLSFNGCGRNPSKTQGLGLDEWDFENICDRYQGVEFRNGDGIHLMKEVKHNANAFVFADPPYVQKLRGNKKIYRCEMPDEEQRKMLETICDAKCRIMLCGYAEEEGSNLYDEYLFPCGWRRYQLAELVQSCENVEQGGERKYGTEYIWVNYELPACAKDYISMESMRCAKTAKRINN